MFFLYLCVCVWGVLLISCVARGRERAALLTDPFKGNMVERAVKVGQESTETLQERLSLGIFASQQSRSSFTWGENIDLWPRVDVQPTVSFPLYVLSDWFCVIVRPSVLWASPHRGVRGGGGGGRCSASVRLQSNENFYRRQAGKYIIWNETGCCCQVHACVDRTGTFSVSFYFLTFKTINSVTFSHTIRQCVPLMANLWWGQTFKSVLIYKQKWEKFNSQ